jgi:hypothetical protein
LVPAAWTKSDDFQKNYPRPDPQFPVSRERNKINHNVNGLTLLIKNEGILF